VLDSVIYSVLFAKKISLGGSTTWCILLFVTFSLVQCRCPVRYVHVDKGRRFLRNFPLPYSVV
jgi:hypothetical protein